MSYDPPSSWIEDAEFEKLDATVEEESGESVDSLVPAPQRTKPRATGKYSVPVRGILNDYKGLDYGRIDEDTKKALDDWVETGAVKSRSAAAALFMREGIKVRSGELEQLREALDDLGQAKERLKEKARQVIGEIPETEAAE